MNDWMTARRLFGPDRLNVVHEPMSARYFRAANNRALIVRTGLTLGDRPASRPDCSEIAIWCPHPRGSRYCRYYACIRVLTQAGGPVLSGTIFCFYDGDDDSPCFKTLEVAREYAQDNGFQ